MSVHKSALTKGTWNGKMKNNNGVWLTLNRSSYTVSIACVKWALGSSVLKWHVSKASTWRMSESTKGTLTVVLGDSGIYRPVRRREWLLQIMWPLAGQWSGISGFWVKSHPATRETDSPMNSLGHVTLRESGKADKTRPQRKPRYIRHILFPFARFGSGSSYLTLTLPFHLSPITSISAFTSPLFLSLSFLW